ncbi:MAG: aryl-sulfate sulfotransferase [Phycisphaerales bacterium]
MLRRRSTATLVAPLALGLIAAAPAAHAGESTCPADLTLNGTVDFADVLTVLSGWGSPNGDVDGDGDTDFADLVPVLASWGTCPDGPSPGWTLVSPRTSTTTTAIDLDGNVVRSWTGASIPASFGYLTPDGGLVRPTVANTSNFDGPGAGGRVQVFRPDGTIDWDFTYADDEVRHHHDVAVMPNGNVLMIAWELRTNAEAIAAGRQGINSDFWPDTIVEVAPDGDGGGTVVWQWRMWDHLIQDADPARDNFGVIADHPELIDINLAGINSGGNWSHVNSIDYNPELDQIVFSSRAFSEFFVIDHSTTTEEAAGHTGGASGKGGDILYRWGQPANYDRGDASDRYFFVIHGANWIQGDLPGSGNILAFNNGDRPGTANDWSTVAEIAPPRDAAGDYIIDKGAAFGPIVPTWEYGDPGQFYGGPVQCGAFRQPNGNTLISINPTGESFEVTTEGMTVWEYDHPGIVARMPRFWMLGGSFVGP